jgi:hypothetical protein
MSDSDKQFLGTFFDRDTVLKLSRVLGWLALAVAVIYALDLAIGLGVWVLQYARGFLGGMGPTDIAQQLLFLIERPIHGIVYYAVLRSLSIGLLIFLDIEDNTRRRMK